MRTALLSQKGSVIAFFAMTRGVVPQTKCLRMHSYRARLRNHPPHDLDCCLDRAALLTQEGNSAYFDTSSVLQCRRLAPILRSTDLAKANVDSCAWPGGAIVSTRNNLLR
jgi:hypothetical protein